MTLMCMFLSKEKSDVDRDKFIVWDLIGQRKYQEGLGILILEVENDTLVLKMVHKFINCTNTPWVN